MYGETHGIEITANWKVSSRWTISPGYTLEQLHMHTEPGSADIQSGGFVEGGTPHHSAQLRSHLDLRQNLSWETSASFANHLTNQGLSTFERIPAFTRLDTGLTWKPGEAVSVSVFGQDLLNDHHIEFEDVFGSMQSGQIKRSAYAKLTWRF
jgi:iron complex outermembrane receptor protein